MGDDLGSSFSLKQARELRDEADQLERQAKRLRRMALAFDERGDESSPSTPKKLGWISSADDTPALAEHASAILEARELRSQFLPPQLFGEPGWNMLLDLFKAMRIQHRVPITSLCIASGAPPTTALRWITVLEDAGLIEKAPCKTDARITYIELSADGATIMRSALRAMARVPR